MYECLHVCIHPNTYQYGSIFFNNVSIQSYNTFYIYNGCCTDIIYIYIYIITYTYIYINISTQSKYIKIAYSSPHLSASPRLCCCSRSSCRCSSSCNCRCRCLTARMEWPLTEPTADGRFTYLQISSENMQSLEDSPVDVDLG